MSKIDFQEIRADFPIFKNNDLIYLDSAATTQKPLKVTDAVSNFYSKSYANVHRGLYKLSTQATEKYHSSRLKVANFINAKDWRSVIFTSGTTESINLVAHCWGKQNLTKDDEILITEMEHHSNIVPWQLIAQETGATLKYIPINKNGTLELEFFDNLLTERTKIISIIHQSNVFGTINPIDKIIEKAKRVNAITLIDAAQSISHLPINVQDLDCDFLAFSGHKMLGPTGIGILYGKKELLEIMEPFMGGGDMINSVTMQNSTWNEIPYKFEAGTPNIAQAIGFGAAIDYLNDISLETIDEQLNYLTNVAIDKLSKIDGIEIYGHTYGNCGSIISFNLKNIHPHDLAQLLDQDNIAVRAGHHCAQPIIDKLGVSSTIRASFYIYNTVEEIDKFYMSIEKAKLFFK